MYFAITAILINIATAKWGDWRNWKQYYPTILFFIIGNQTYELLAYRTPLWEYTDLFGDYMVLLVGIMLLLFPGTVILFLSLFPKKKIAQVLYVLGWAVSFALVEYLSIQLQVFGHYRGWSMYYTLAHNVLMFSMLRLHYKRPLLAWPISFLLAFLVLWHFRLPFEIMR